MIKRIPSIFLLLFVLQMSCSEKNDIQQEIEDKDNTPSQSITLKSGVEALIKEESALWSNSALKVLNSENWSNAKPIMRLNAQSKVFVLDVRQEFSKIKTATYFEGWIVSDQLLPSKI
jgi:hypothetical protein